MSTPSLGPPSTNGMNILDTSGSVHAGLSAINDYLDSTYTLQNGNALLQSSISTAESAIANGFQQQLTSTVQGTGYNAHGSNVIAQMQAMSPSASNAQTELGVLGNLYSIANSQNSAVMKVKDGELSGIQNISSEIVQGQQQIIQAMGSLNQVVGNLAHLIQG